MKCTNLVGCPCWYEYRVMFELYKCERFHPLLSLQLGQLLWTEVHILIVDRVIVQPIRFVDYLRFIPNKESSSTFITSNWTAG